MIESTNIQLHEKDAKLIIFLTILLIVVVAFGCFYGGIQYSKTRFVEESTYELEQLLLTNFSYVCGAGWEQYYLDNLDNYSISLESIK